MKIAISGKGGVGKTTLTACLARDLAEAGTKVFAIDADPAMNLARALGVSDETEIEPVAEMKDLIHERTGATSEEFGGFFKANPQVSDLPEKLCVEVGGVRVMTIGGIQKGGGGCACPENVFLRSLLGHLIVLRDEAVLLDMEAGVEHLGRATVKSVDALLIVVEPGRRSIDTAKRVQSLASDIGIERMLAVGNRIQNERHKQFVIEGVEPLPVLGMISYSEEIADADMAGMSPWDDNDQLKSEIAEIRSNLLHAIRR